MSYEAYDPDRFDVEILLDRSGITSFTFEGFGKYLGVHRQSLRSAVSEGRMEAPLLRTRVSHFGVDRHEWSREQVINILLSGRHPRPIASTAPCGTEAAAARHLRRGTPLCDPCRRARAAANNARYHKNKKKKAAA